MRPANAQSSQLKRYKHGDEWKPPPQRYHLVRITDGKVLSMGPTRKLLEESVLFEAGFSEVRAR